MWHILAKQAFQSIYQLDGNVIMHYYRKKTPKKGKCGSIVGCRLYSSIWAACRRSCVKMGFLSCFKLLIAGCSKALQLWVVGVVWDLAWVLPAVCVVGWKLFHRMLARNCLSGVRMGSLSCWCCWLKVIPAISDGGCWSGVTVRVRSLSCWCCWLKVVPMTSEGGCRSGVTVRVGSLSCWCWWLQVVPKDFRWRSLE